jgi:SAM-dependent methyltransferase
MAYLGRQSGAAARPEITLALANAENLPFADAFDVVIASELLEHVLNVGDLLVSLHRALADRGRLFVRVPYREDLRQYARQNGCPYPFVHLRTFTRDSLVDMLRRAGFRPRRIRYDGHFGGTRRRLGESRPANVVLDRLLEDGVPRPRAGRRVLGLFLRPITLTAEFEKR